MDLSVFSLCWQLVRTLKVRFIWAPTFNTLILGLILRFENKRQSKCSCRGAQQEINNLDGFREVQNQAEKKSIYGPITIEQVYIDFLHLIFITFLCIYWQFPMHNYLNLAL